MLNKFLAIGFLIGLVFGVISMVLLRESEPEQKPETTIYEYEMTRIENKKLKDSIARMKTNQSVIHIYDSIYVDRLIFKTIYEKIPFSNSVGRDSAFDTLLSN